MPTLRDAGPEDLPRIVEIYNASIPGRCATADTESVSLESKRAWFAEHSPESVPLWVLERGGEITGWLSFSRFYGRPAYAGTAELSVYVAPEFQRKAVATRLLGAALARAPELGFTTLLGFIFGHNDPSLRLFAKFGFEEWGQLPRIARLDDIERDLIIVGRRTD